MSTMNKKLKRLPDANSRHNGDEAGGTYRAVPRNTLRNCDGPATQTDRQEQTDRQTERQTDRQTDRPTDTRTDSQTDPKTHTQHKQQTQIHTKEDLSTTYATKITLGMHDRKHVKPHLAPPVIDCRQPGQQNPLNAEPPQHG